MKKVTGPYAGMMANLLANYSKYIEQLKTDSKSKFGFFEKEGFNYPCMSPKRLAVQLDTSIKTLERLRKNGSGPPFIKYATKQIRYPITTLDAWVIAKLKEAGHWPEEEIVIAPENETNNPK